MAALYAWQVSTSPLQALLQRSIPAQLRVVRRLLALPPGLLRRLSGGNLPTKDGQTLEPEIQFLLAASARAGLPELDELPPGPGRQMARRSWVPLASRSGPLGRVEDLEIQGSAGQVIPFRVYEPKGQSSKRPALVYIHGGGFMLGDLDTHDPVCRFFAESAGCTVISVHYRRAPEHVFPAAVDDCLAVVDWAFEEGASSLGLDQTRIAVGGDSAGGNLSAVICQQRRNGSRPSPCYQLLLYPMTDPHSATASREIFSHGYLLTNRAVDFFSANYFDRPEDYSDVRGAPLLADDFSDLPPAHVVTAGYDPLRDQGRAYADKLEQAGVATTYTCHPGLVHGFASFAGVVPAADRAMQQMAALLRTRFRELEPQAADAPAATA